MSGTREVGSSVYSSVFLEKSVEDQVLRGRSG